MSAYPVFISVGLTILVQMTFICPCADCICKLPYYHAIISTALISLKSLFIPLYDDAPFVMIM